MYNFSYIQSLMEHYQAATVSQEISPNDTMNNQWYFDIGRSAIEVITTACMAAPIHAVKKVLDVPCGHGRVLRHLIHLFPGAEYHACDLDQDGVEFCASTFGALPIHSQEDLSAVDFGCQYDLIWVGSLFTHTARDITKKWMAHLAKFLSPYGIAVCTVHGRWCPSVYTVFPYLAEDRWREIVKEYSSSGYGYRDYSRAESHSFISGSYGVSLAKPHATIQNVEDIPGVRIYLYLERGWGDHHDVVAFGRPAYDEPWPNMAK
ncbi:MAG: class I SAM-dependent methyltransferase [Pirellulales bacterium]|nr:class I SAM-dependent methyltransferase [Pirellulales bacterium]